MTLAQVRAICVTPFKSSLTRKSIMEGLVKVIDKLSAAGIVGSLWLDGSFLTEKIDPDDVDYLLHVGSDIYDLEPAKQIVIDWASAPDLKDSHSCDAYKWIEYRAGHPLYSQSEQERKEWTVWYGVSRSKKDRKGIVVVSLPVVA